MNGALTTDAHGVMRVDPSLVVLSEGCLPPMEDGAFTVEETAPHCYAVTFTWTDNSSLPFAFANDKLIYLLYSPDDARVVTNAKGRQKILRHDGRCTLTVTCHGCHTFQVYTAFVNANRTASSASVWLGSFEGR